MMVHRTWINFVNTRTIDLSLRTLGTRLGTYDWFHEFAELDCCYSGRPSELMASSPNLPFAVPITELLLKSRKHDKHTRSQFTYRLRNRRAILQYHFAEIIVLINFYAKMLKIITFWKNCSSTDRFLIFFIISNNLKKFYSLFILAENLKSIEREYVCIFALQILHCAR
jgi:hypothetical protein